MVFSYLNIAAVIWITIRYLCGFNYFIANLSGLLWGPFLTIFKLMATCLGDQVHSTIHAYHILGCSVTHTHTHTEIDLCPSKKT